MDAAEVEATAGFSDLSFGLARHVQLPPDAPAAYVGLRRDLAALAVVS